MAIKKLQPGYRIRVTAFVPYDPTDPKSVRAAADFADQVKSIGEGENAPQGVVIEDFSFQPGRSKEAKS